MTTARDTAHSTKHTALHQEHLALGATFTDFGGWAMPLKYVSELAEHHAVRQKAGLFDLSHMGEVSVVGPDAARFLDYALVGNLSAVAVSRAKYTLMCNAEGGIVDDLISYRLGFNEYLAIPNAGNASTVTRELIARAVGFDVVVTDVTDATSLIAIQGPFAERILALLLEENEASRISTLKYYATTPATVSGAEVLIARTGYTGEDGFEVFVSNPHAIGVWRALLDAGQDSGLVPAGLASRDSLRLECGMPLYGNELSPTIDPYGAGLGAVVAMDAKEGDFVGRRALEAVRVARQADPSTARVLVGLMGTGRRAARACDQVISGGSVVGEVTSGIPSPTLGYPVALAYVDAHLSTLGTEVQVDVRGTLQPFHVSRLPFYRRPA